VVYVFVKFEERIVMGQDFSEYLNRKTYQSTRLEVLEALTLPPEIYRAGGFHKIEAEKVFGHAWVCIGYTCQVDEPGKMLTATVSDQPIVVTRDKQGDLRGFYNVCRHRGSILVTKDDKLERFRCPYHSWTYDLTGKLQNCPLFLTADQPQSFKKEDYSLLPIRIETWGCFVFVNLDKNAEPLSDYLGDLPHHYKNFPLDELVLVKRKSYSIKSNWKLIAENFLEYYHLPWVHPELCEVTAIDMHKRNQGQGMYMSFYASPLLKGNTPLDADYLPAMPNLGPNEATSGYFPFVFPNLALFLLPHHVFCLIMRPTSIDTTEEFGDILVHPSLLNEPGYEEKLEAIFKFYDMVNIQDIVAVERVQQGIAVKDYPGGRMSHRFEEPVHRFQNMVIDYLTGERRQYPGD
jgi:choline monooxygenase